MTAPKLSERLKRWRPLSATDDPHGPTIAEEVAALEQRLEQAEARVEKMREALHPGDKPESAFRAHDNPIRYKRKGAR